MDVSNSAGISLPATFDSAGRARRFTLRHLHDWGCDEIGDDARLVVSELVTNMVRHAPHGGYLKLMLGPDRVRISMTDHGQGTIAQREPAPEEPSGRGLLIVERLSHRWGVDLGPDDRGHTVWCDLSFDPRSSARGRDARTPRSTLPRQGVVDATPVAVPPMELNGG